MILNVTSTSSHLMVRTPRGELTILVSAVVIVNTPSLKLVFSKQPIIGLTQEFCWVGTYVG